MAFTLRLPKEIEDKLNKISEKEMLPKTKIIESVLELYFIAYDMSQKEHITEVVTEIEKVDVEVNRHLSIRKYLSNFFGRNDSVIS